MSNTSNNNPGSAAFTPGPWVSSRLNWRNEIDDDRRFICGQNECGHYTGVCIVEGNRTSQVVTEANARLIAAAPDLYEALKEAIQWSPYKGESEETPFLRRARAAIRAVEGGAQ